MHLLHTPSLCGTVNLAGNSRIETREQFYICEAVLTGPLTSSEIGASFFCVQYKNPVTSWPMQGAEL